MRTKTDFYVFVLSFKICLYQTRIYLHNDPLTNCKNSEMQRKCCLKIKYNEGTHNQTKKLLKCISKHRNLKQNCLQNNALLQA